MGKKGLQLVFTLEEKGDKSGVTAEFMRDGKAITYGDVSLNDKYLFCKTCQNMMGVLANIILAEGKKNVD